jgi:transitional endoplasmic reticulum ATPase
MGEDTDRVLDINTPIELPLSRNQQMALRAPWDDLSLEEEFYIMYDDLNSLVEGAKKVKSPLAALLLKPEEIVNLKELAVKGTMLARYFAYHTAGEIPQVPPGQLIQNVSDLDPDKLKWARTVKEGISKDETLASIWIFYFGYLIAAAMTRLELSQALVNTIIYGTPTEFLENHIEIAEAEAEIYGHRLSAYKETIDENGDKWLQEDFTCSISGDVDRVFDKYGKDNSEELEAAFRKRNEAANRFLKRIQELETKKAKEEGNKDPGRSSFLGFLKNVIDIKSGDCGNPDCPVHGTAAKQRQQTAVPQLPASTSNSNSATEEQRTNTTMATAPDKNKKDEIKFTNVSVQFVDDPNSKAIQLPNGMTYKEGRHWLQKIEEEETRTFQFQYKFTGWSPLDAMWAAYRALSELHGFVHVGDFQSWFGPTPPSMITIEIDYGETQQMPWGPIEVSGFSSPLVPSLDLVEGHPTLVFSATIRNNERSVADKLMKRTEKFLLEASIYRGKAIEADFEVVNPRDFRFDPTKAPKFWDTSKTRLDELILSKQVERLIRTNIWTPIRKTEQARQHQIPLRRTTLLAGNYGVGKTLGARATAKIAQENGWTFLYLRNLSQIKAALYFAKKYQPCVIFAEDINRITAGKRDAEMDELFNVIDGIDRKNDEVMLVFTTNDIKEIHPGMIRPGRIDTVITVTPPDADAAERLVRLYGRDLIDPAADLKQVGIKLTGQIPAIIREAVERSKLAAIEDNNGGPLVVSAEHLDIAADQMLEHAEFLKEPEPDAPDMEVLGTAIGNTIAHGLYHGLHKVETNPEVVATAKDRLHGILEDAGIVTINGNGHATHSQK